MERRLQKLLDAGQSVWLDDLNRALLTSGELRHRIDQGVRGVTSNPTIFGNAMAHGSDYDAAIAELGASHRDAESLFWELAIADVRDACDLFRPLYDSCDGCDGFVSLEVSPMLAHGTQYTIAMARDLWRRVDRPNAMIKIPATPEGIPAIEECTADGININVTLVFSDEMYEAAAQAYVRGLQRRLDAGLPIEHLASANSLFLSRIDAVVDPMPRAVLGAAAIAAAKLAYRRYLEIFGSAQFAPVAEHGGRAQRPLWASTGTKNPAYGDLKYVEPLVGSNTISTMPEKTLDAFIDHGAAQPDAVSQDLPGATESLERMRAAGIDLDAVARRLRDEGLQKFCDSFQALLEAIEGKRRNAPVSTWQPFMLHGRADSLAERELPATSYAFPHSRELPLIDSESIRRAWLKLRQIVDDGNTEITLARVNIRHAAEFHGVALDESQPSHSR